MATAIESGIGTLNYGRQTAKGAIATAATTAVGYNRPKWQGGALAPKKQLGMQEYVDGNRFGSPAVFTDKVAGELGTLTLQLQGENAGLYSAAVLGVDVVTGASDPYTHTITSAGTSGHWATWWQKVGSAVGPERAVYWDSKISKLVLRHNFADKILTGELTIAGLVGGEVYAVDAAKTEDQTDPYLHTEATGAISFDAAVQSEINEVITEIDTKMQPYYGDDIKPVQLIEGKGEITCTVKTIVTDTSLGQYRKAIYNNAAPTAGTQPVKAVYYAAITETLTKSATRTFTQTLPKVAIDPSDMQVAPLPEGGPIELSMGGKALKSGATPALTIVALSADATTYA